MAPPSVILSFPINEQWITLISLLFLTLIAPPLPSVGRQPSNKHDTKDTVELESTSTARLMALKPPCGFQNPILKKAIFVEFLISIILPGSLLSPENCICFA